MLHPFECHGLWERGQLRVRLPIRQQLLQSSSIIRLVEEPQLAGNQVTPRNRERFPKESLASISRKRFSIIISNLRNTTRMTVRNDRSQHILKHWTNSTVKNSTNATKPPTKCLNHFDSNHSFWNHSHAIRVLRSSPFRPLLAERSPCDSVPKGGAGKELGFGFPIGRLGHDVKSSREVWVTSFFFRDFGLV